MTILPVVDHVAKISPILERHSHPNPRYQTRGRMSLRWAGDQKSSDVKPFWPLFFDQLAVATSAQFMFLAFWGWLTRAKNLPIRGAVPAAWLYRDDVAFKTTYVQRDLLWFVDDCGDVFLYFWHSSDISSGWSDVVPCCAFPLTPSFRHPPDPDWSDQIANVPVVNSLRRCKRSSHLAASAFWKFRNCWWPRLDIPTQPTCMRIPSVTIV